MNARRESTTKALSNFAAGIALLAAFEMK